MSERKGLFRIKDALSSSGVETRRYGEILGSSIVTDNDIALVEKWNKALDDGGLEAAKATGYYKDMSAGVQKVVDSCGDAQVNINALTAAQRKYTAATIAATAMQTVFNTAISFGIGTLIQGIGSAIDAWVNYRENVIEAMNEITDEFNTANEAFTSDNDSLKSLEPEFEKLSKGVDDYGKNISLSADEYKRYQEIVAEILDISPQLIEGYDAEGNAIANKNNLIERSIELRQMELDIARQEYFNPESAGTMLAGKKAEYNNIADEINLMRTDLSNQIFNDITNEIGSKPEKLTNILKQVLGDDVVEHYGNIQSLIASELDQVVDNFDKISVLAQKQGITTEEEINAISSQITLYKQKNAALDVAAKGMSSYVQQYASTLDGYENLDSSSINLLNSYIDAAADLSDAESSEEFFSENSTAVKDMIAALQDLDKQTLNTFNDLQTGFTEGSYTAEQTEKAIQKVVASISKSPNIVSALGLDSSTPNLEQEIRIKLGLDIQEDAVNQLKDRVQEKIDAGNLTIDGFAIDVDTDLTIAQLKEFENMVNNLEFATPEQLAIAMQTVLSNASNQAGSLEEYQDSLASLNSELELYNKAVSEQEQNGYLSSATYQELISANSDYAKALIVENGAMKLNTDATDEMVRAKKEAMLAEVEASRANTVQQYQDNEAQIRRLEEALKSNTNASDEYKQSVRDQIAALREQQGTLESNVAGYDVLASEIRNSMSAYSEFQEALNGPQENDQYNDLIKAVEVVTDALEYGTTNTRVYKKALELLFDDSSLDPSQVEAKIAEVSEFINSEDGINGVINKFQELQSVITHTNEDGTISFEIPNLSETATELGVSQEALEGIMGLISMYTEVDFSDTTEGAAGLAEQGTTVNDKLTEAKSSLDTLNTTTVNDLGFPNLTKSIQDSINRVNNLIRRINSIPTVGFNGGALGWSGQSGADGISSAQAGHALVGEEAPELVQSGNHAYMVGLNGPEIVRLKQGDIVYSGDDTKRILGGNGSKRFTIPAFKSGTGATTGGLKPHYKVEGSSSSKKASDSLDKVSAAADALERELDQLKDELEDLKDLADRYKQANDAVIKILEDEIEALEDHKDALEESYNLQIEAIDKEIDRLQDKQDEEDRQQRLKDAQERLENAKRNKTVRIYSENIGWYWTVNTDEIKQAEEELKDAQLDITIAGLEDKKEKLENEKDAAISQIDEQIDRLQDLKDQWKESLDLYEEFENHEAMLDLIGNVEQMSYDQRLAALKKFSDEYFDLQAQIAAKQLQIDIKQEEYDKAKGGYASGTTNATRGIHRINESGTELLVRNPSKKYAYLEAGDGVLPANITRNLWSLGRFNVASLTDTIERAITPQVIRAINVSANAYPISESHDLVISGCSFTLPNVTDVPSFVRELGIIQRNHR